MASVNNNGHLASSNWSPVASDLLKVNFHALAFIWRIDFKQLSRLKSKSVSDEDAGECFPSGIILHNTIVVCLACKRNLIFRGG